MVDDYCGDLHVRIDVHDQGHFVSRPTGPNRCPRSTATHHGGVTITNLATDKAFTVTWNYGEIDVNRHRQRRRHLHHRQPGPRPGTVGTGPTGNSCSLAAAPCGSGSSSTTTAQPNNPGDDFVVSEEFIGEHGGKPQDDFDAVRLVPHAHRLTRCTQSRLSHPLRSQRERAFCVGAARVLGGLSSQWRCSPLRVATHRRIRRVQRRPG